MAVCFDTQRTASIDEEFDIKISDKRVGVVMESHTVGRVAIA